MNESPTASIDISAYNSQLARNQELAIKAITSIISVAKDLEIGDTIADAIHPDFLELANDMCCQQTLGSISLNTFVDRSLRPSTRILDSLQHFCASLSDKERFIIEMRICEEHPLTLDEIGRRLDVTRERVRQIQSKLEKGIDSRIGIILEFLAHLLNSRLPPIMDEEALNSRIAKVLSCDDSLVENLAQSKLRKALGYKSQGEILLSNRAVEVLETIHKSVNDYVDDVGLIDEQQMADACLPSAEWTAHWYLLTKCAKFSRIGNFLCLRNSKPARVKSALLKIGRPATKQEISAECDDIPPQNVGGALSNIPSIVRADKKNWGLREWIDDEYFGIVEEIIQRIRDGEGVASASLLIKEIPEKFGVSPNSVKGYLNTPQFEVQDDVVREVTSPTFTLQDLELVIDGRDDDGCPMWKFTVKSRYLEGYSLVGVPYEIASAVGCQPGDDIRVKIARPTNCRQLSVSWPIASITKANIGYLTDPLKQLGATHNDSVYLIIKKEGLVEMRLAGKISRDDSAQSILEKMKRRKQVM